MSKMVDGYISQVKWSDYQGIMLHDTSRHDDYLTALSWCEDVMMSKLVAGSDTVTCEIVRLEKERSGI